MIIVRRSLATVCVMLCTLSTLFAQGSKTDTPPRIITTALTVTVAATAERVRFTAPGAVVRMHLEIYSDAGETLFDGSSKGNVFDWTLADSTGQRVTDGSYLCVVTAKILSGKLSQRIGTVLVQGQQVSVRAAQSAQLSAAQQQAVGPVEENSALTVLAAGDVPSATVIAHDGQNGQVTSTRGALTFRTGDLFSGKEQEGMRLTEEGNLGLGTETPEARLDVNGMVRARQGFQFSDGSILDLSPKGGGLRVTSPGGKTTSVNLAPNAVAGTANRLPKFDTNGSSLLDSALYQDANTGYIGWGTTTPAHPFTVRRNGGTLGVHSFGELYVDRDDRTRSASMILGTGGTLKWIFGMPYQDDGFQVFDLLASPAPGVSRFYVHPTSGNIGIGTNIPANKLVVVPGGSGGEINFGTPGGETGMAIIGANRADVRFDGSTLKLLAGTGPGAMASTNGININRTGLVGVGTTNPTLGRLHVVSSDSALPAIYGESANRGGWGKSTSGSRGVFGESVSGEGVHGESTSGTGVAGFTQSASNLFPGVYGSSSASGGVGVRGDGTTGVYGNSTSATGYGVFAINPNGLALGVAGNASQNRDKGGLVKAMIYVNTDGTVKRCFNSQMLDGGTSLPPSGMTGCGFTVSPPPGQGLLTPYVINFGFKVDDRFVSFTPAPENATNLGANLAESLDSNPNLIRVYLFVTTQNVETTKAPFMAIVY